MAMWFGWLGGRSWLPNEREHGWRWRPRFLFHMLSCGYVGEERRMDRPGLGIFKWTGSSIAPPTATSRSRENLT